MKPNVAIIGLGYVGVPTAIAMAKAGMNVTGIDIDAKRVSQLNACKSFINEIKDDELKAVRGNFRATTDW
ncbi:MAG: Nucleotide sugar dehydrogenase, partial [Parcubacteria group bacterium GW2011_GWB1_45_9]